MKSGIPPNHQFVQWRECDLQGYQLQLSHKFIKLHLASVSFVVPLASPPKPVPNVMNIRGNIASIPFKHFFLAEVELACRR